MTTTRKIGAIAALSGMATAVSLLTALPGARADELADLKANQQILQQELNKLQIEQQAAATAAPLPPGAPSLAGSFPRSFLIPGTNTSIRIGGYVALDIADYVTGGGNNNNATQPAGTGSALVAGIPLKLPNPPGVAAPIFNPSSRSHNWVQLQASESRLFVNTRTPTAWGEATTVLQMDFWGCTASGPACSGLDKATNPDLPRLRLAYGTLGGFEAGQNWVPGNDLEASPTILDFYGSVGTWGFARAPQIGYKFPLPVAGPLGGSTLGVYAVSPQTEMATPVGGIESDDQSAASSPALGDLAVNPTKYDLPDFAGVWNLERPWGHFQLHGVVTHPVVDDGHLINRSFWGYGGGVSGTFKFFPVLYPRDQLGFNAYGGKGIGHWGGPNTGNDTEGTHELISNFGGPGLYGSVGGPTTAAAAALIRIQKVPMWGAEANYSHWWARQWESNVDFSVFEEDLSTVLLAPVSAANQQFNHRLYVGHLNLLYFPVSFVRVGLEYTYDHRQTIWHQSASANVVMGEFRVQF
jgi:hypothetical protein